MPKSLPLTTPLLNRLRAAAALIPIIESGLSDRTLSQERAALMASFCEWANTVETTTPEELRLAETVGQGLIRLQGLLMLR